MRSGRLPPRALFTSYPGLHSQIGAGRHPLTCSRCGEVTIVTSSLEKDDLWRVRRAAREEKPAAVTPRR